MEIEQLESMRGIYMISFSQLFQACIISTRVLSSNYTSIDGDRTEYHAQVKILLISALPSLPWKKGRRREGAGDEEATGSRVFQKRIIIYNSPPPLA
ncbi:hypothetical protein RIR_jg16915.t1 [Rhizophagus irregularis DAOM 181602=DAOM 197198]|uniref:Uncharacterized protein n=1 Tax=Rhizophagus irregularis (strain DAOM 181602 / DAOM 197198 / MUCL 43194) TaxID=747089 RepID=U9UQL6_RHIID|nr:hypothetical protein RIR_jg16915.t1 [Rhizophagus irregularis DAOM 181602=DAOM 197198]